MDGIIALSRRKVFTFSNKTTATRVAHIGLHAQMPIGVVEQRLFRFEIATARSTRVRFDVRMHPLMHHQVAFALETLAADLT